MKLISRGHQVISKIKCEDLQLNQLETNLGIDKIEFVYSSSTHAYTHFVYK